MRSLRIGAALVVVVLLSACGATGTFSVEATPYVSSSPGASTSGSVAASPSGSSAGSPSAQPTVSPTAAPVLAALTLVRVTVSTLNVRVAPSASGKLLQPPAFPPVSLPLTSGSRVLVLSGPVQADGYAWYAVGLPMDPKVSTALIPVGWVAGASGATPWLVPDTRSCPTPGVQAIATLTGIERIGCFGSSTLSFAAHQTAEPPDAGLGGTCGAPADQPAWLVCENINYSWVNADGGTTGLLLLHFDPATGISPTNLAAPNTTGPAYQITGHFDDTAAQACGDTSDPTNLAEMSAWLTCASEFVVETLKTS